MRARGGSPCPRSEPSTIAPIVVADIFHPARAEGLEVECGRVDEGNVADLILVEAVVQCWTVLRLGPIG